jgi:hypothetical protein
MDALLKKIVDKSVIIADQKVELDRLCSLLNESRTANKALQQGVLTAESEETKMEVDATALDHVIENATYGLLDLVTLLLGRRRENLMLPPPPTQQPLNIEET